MSDLAALRSLLARVEAAEGPDRELDRDIAISFGRPWDYAADWGGWGYGADGMRIEKPVAQPYTASIDAVVALIDRALPERSWSISLHRTGSTTLVATGTWETARMARTEVRTQLTETTPPLKALIAKEEGRG
ncbi:hypothetical protein FHS82_000998 [Pseudochelatococcus lubricantis]|uniref:Uncharacterized protein n=1 Tax=Pseudochelatococcus lubricantis TaxID=1538102 RepID=A0ABX0UW37_9HYPH|nr:hypothetical protein [Pseudochelatococcus lubricantis]NIJ57172.1 hypothetical protein [Pseudochelatococcus lubricantis]